MIYKSKWYVFLAPQTGEYKGWQYVSWDEKDGEPPAPTKDGCVAVHVLEEDMPHGRHPFQFKHQASMEDGNFKWWDPRAEAPTGRQEDVLPNDGSRSASLFLHGGPPHQKFRAVGSPGAAIAGGVDKIFDEGGEAVVVVKVFGCLEATVTVEAGGASSYHPFVHHLDIIPWSA